MLLRNEETLDAAAAETVVFYFGQVCGIRAISVGGRIDPLMCRFLICDLEADPQVRSRSEDHLFDSGDSEGMERSAPVRSLLHPFVSDAEPYKPGPHTSGDPCWAIKKS